MTQTWKDQSGPLVLGRLDAAGQIAAHLRQLIVRGVWRPGERLPRETELAADFAVSRGTVREALKVLGASGMVHAVRGNTGGTFVSLPTVDWLTESLGGSIRMRATSGPVTLAEIDEARLHLELSCVELAAVRRTDEDLALMAANVQRSRDPSLSRTEWLEANAEFHVVLAGAAKNEILAIAMRAVHIARPFADAGDADAAAEAIRRRVVIDQHEMLREAIGHRDPAAATAALRAHVAFLHQTTQREGTS
jgi:GntR family transcriptional repressor for pyruvate dehydrogenase complex